MTQPQTRVARPTWMWLVVAIVPVIVASVVGQWATFPNLAPWYAALAKPSFNPPNWVFGPVWTALYVLMAYSVWRILAARERNGARRTALTLFFVQLALNALWSWLFFGWHNPLAGLVEVVLQFLVIVATIVSFGRVDRAAAWCMVPLAAWVAFASALNIAIWHLNG